MNVERALLACPKAGDRTRSQVAALLRAGGLEVTVAADSCAAVRALETQRFDLLVADVRAKTADGLPLLAAIAERHPGLPACALAETPRFESARDALRAGAVDVLTTPIDAQNVAEAVARARRRRAKLSRDVPAARPAVPSAETSLSPGSRPFAATLAEAEKVAILRTLVEAGGNRTESARRLGISVRTLWNRLKRYQDEGVVLPARRRARVAVRAEGGRSC